MDSRATYDSDTLEKKLHDPTEIPISLPIQFLKDITHNFSGQQELGRGRYGVVYKGVLPSGKFIAVKKIFGISRVEDEQFRREVRNLMGIKHQNIVKLVGYCAESRLEAIRLPSGRHDLAPVATSLLCFEYLCNNSLKEHVSDESSGLDWYRRFEIIKGICSGLHFLHEKRIIHRDLKPGNIMMDATMMPKIVDFGLSKLLGIEKSATVISGNREGLSREYMAPEYIYQGQISTKADVFSLGVIIIEIITGCNTIVNGKFLQPSSSNQSIEIARQQYIENVLRRWRNIFKKKQMYYRSPDIYVQQVKECITIALRCLDRDKLRRPNAREILQMLSAVESTKFHVEDSKDSVGYQVQDEVKARLMRSLQDTVTPPQPLPSNSPTFKLELENQSELSVYTGTRIVETNDSPLKIAITTDSPAPPLPTPLPFAPLQSPSTSPGAAQPHPPLAAAAASVAPAPLHHNTMVKLNLPTRQSSWWTNTAAKRRTSMSIIADMDPYLFDPWELPETLSDLRAEVNRVRRRLWNWDMFMPRRLTLEMWRTRSNVGRMLRDRVLEDTTRNFLREQQLGRGGYEVVYRGVLLLSRLQGPASPLKKFDHDDLHDFLFGDRTSDLVGGVQRGRAPVPVRLEADQKKVMDAVNTAANVPHLPGW